MASDLKPCPFCGGEPALNDPGGSQLADCYGIAIRCQDCDAEVSGLVDQDYCDDGGAEVRGDVVAAWNRRTPADLSAAEAAAAWEAVERCAEACEAERNEQLDASKEVGPAQTAHVFAAAGAELCRAAIRALAPPPPGALDRVRQAARAEGMEDAAKILEDEAEHYSEWSAGELADGAAAAIRAAKDQPA